MDKKSKGISLKAILIIIALGIWVLIIQNVIIHNNQIVYVRGGNIDASIENTVDVKGSVDVYNTVSVSIEQVRGTDNRYYYFNNR
jgi:hypothetical protein